MCYIANRFIFKVPVSFTSSLDGVPLLLMNACASFHISHYIQTTPQLILHWTVSFWRRGDMHLTPLIEGLDRSTLMTVKYPGDLSSNKDVTVLN